MLALAAATACRPAPAARSGNPLDAPPIDAQRVRSVEEAAAWAYHRDASADLDGDGRAERIVIAADVTVRADGRPLWEDGHRWAVYVEAPAGERTLLYAAFVPNGFAEAAILAAGQDGRRRVLVQERTPPQVRALDLEYLRPGTARTMSAAHYQVEQWLPGSAALP